MGEKNVRLDIVQPPKIFDDVAPVYLLDRTINERLDKILTRMDEEMLDILIIYADKEHGGNFEYLTGFIPRFEEGLLVLKKSGTATLILGNENLKLAKHARIKVDLIHYPQFSLPNQPMDGEKSLADILRELDLPVQAKIGIVGWKMFTTINEEASELFDVPYFIVETIKQVAGETAKCVNAAHIFIGEKGARPQNNANELAHYEYGANLASRAIFKAMDLVEPGISEAEIGEALQLEGQNNTVVTIAATGQRFAYANLYPTHKQIKRGDPLSMTTGFKGGLSSRTGYVIEDASELPEQQKDYLERIAKPYFLAIVTWLETLRVGQLGGDIYQAIEQIFPKQTYHWHLNPGHLVADEEWMASPIYEGSRESIKSGMIFQTDIIPSVSGYAGISVEECVAVADDALKMKIQEEYPELWKRIVARREYLINTLGIQLSPDILPFSNTVAYLRPFYLAKQQAFKISQ